MDRRVPLDAAVKAAKAVVVKVGTTAGIAAVGAAVLVLVGVVTAMVTSRPNPGLVALLFILGVLAAVLAAVQQRGSQAQQVVATPSSMALYDPLADGPFGYAGLLAELAYRASTWPSPASSQSAPDPESGPLVNRVNEREQLGQTLTEDSPAVIVVDGPPGVGKSALVSRALLEAGQLETSLSETGPNETAVRRYELPGDRFDARRLCEDIALDTQSDIGLRPSEDVLNRLEAAVQAPDGAPVTIVVDGAPGLLT
jgi:hypothetical protein